MKGFSLFCVDKNLVLDLPLNLQRHISNGNNQNQSGLIALLDKLNEALTDSEANHVVDEEVKLYLEECRID